MKRLLIVGAHPDDETFFAGTMARYAGEGARVSIVCGTRGERGATADLCSIEELPRVREAELRESMAILGVTPVDFLPYEDQKLAGAPADDVRRSLVEIIRKAQPQVVVTFDLEGANGHADHVAISRFTSEAIAASADHRWFPEAGPPHSVSRLVWQPPVRMLRYLALVPDLRNQPGIDFLIDTSRWWQKKEAAIRAHRTQLPGLQTLFFQGDKERNLSTEGFRLAWGPRPDQIPSDDLFAGLDVESS